MFMGMNGTMFGIIKVLNRALRRIHLKKLLLAFCIFVVLYTVQRFLSMHNVQETPNNSLVEGTPTLNVDNVDGILGSHTSQIDELFSAKDCPVCFGTDLCQNLNSSVLTLDQERPSLRAPHKIEYVASYKSNKVLLKTSPFVDFTVVINHLCQSAETENSCSHDAEVIDWNSISIGLDTALQPNQVRRMHAFMKRARNDIPVAMCATDKLIMMLSKVFDEDRDGNLTVAEKLILYTTLALNPETLVLKILKHINLNIPVPQYFGACGRTVMIERALTPLSEFLSRPFDIRASLAAQILQLIEDFLDDPEWLIMLTDLSINNLAVNSWGTVLLVNVEGMAIVDKLSTQSSKDYKEVVQEPCNKECFIQLSHQVLHSKDEDQACRIIPQYGQLMYAIVCQQVLSDLYEHQVNNFFSLYPEDTGKKQEHTGLLHSLPEAHQESVEDLLKECVFESAAGERIQAAEELREYLTEYSYTYSSYNAINPMEYDSNNGGERSNP